MIEDKLDIDKQLQTLKEHEIIGISCFYSDLKHCNHTLCEGLDERGLKFKYFGIQFKYVTKNKSQIPYTICFFKAQKILKIANYT